MDLTAFKNRWLNTFAPDIPAKDIKRYVVSTGNYIWHVFSWELLPDDAYLVGDAARAAYDQADKRGAMYIEPFGKGTTKSITWDLDKASALDNMTEVYVVASDNSWTYIKTHENDWCGPYFLKKSK